MTIFREWVGKFVNIVELVRKPLDNATHPRLYFSSGYEICGFSKIG